MGVLRSLGLFVIAAVAEVGGAWLVWQGVREHRGVVWIGAGISALAAYGFVRRHLPGRPELRSDPRRLRWHLRRRSLAWGVVADGFRPDRFDLIGAAICLAGVAVIMYAPRLR